MGKQECDFFNDSECEKYRKHGICRQRDIGDFEDKFYAINMSEVCRKTSNYGNRFFSITEEDIEALRNGKVLAYVDEYGMFIAMNKRDNE